MKKIELSANKIKSEKGSITLLVLTTMMFLLVILVINYMGVKNKLIEQDKKIKTIQNEYNTVDIDEVYNSTINDLDLNILIYLYKADTGELHDANEWTNKDLKLQIIYPEDVSSEDRYFSIDGKRTKYIENYLIEKSCKISVEYKNKTKTVQAKIDKDAPTLQIFPNGGTIKVNQNTGTISSSVKGTDALSGIKEIKYAISTSNTEKPSDDQYKTLQNGSTISEEKELGTYYLWIKTEDLAGNVKEMVSNSYTIREPLAPTVTMKYSDANGELYTGEWTNKDIYTQIAIPESEGSVQKYEYSTDGITYKEINGEIKEATLNYTTTFPMTSENKPTWLGDLTANGNYYFVEDGNGSIVSNNQGQHNQVANSYIKIDLSGFSEEDLLNISVNAQVSSQSNYDIGYATITETTATPSYSSSTGRFIYIHGTSTTVTTAKDYPVTQPLKGGKVYYLHFGYRKNGSSNSGNDAFTINSITLSSETIDKRMNFYEYTKNGNTITYKLQEDINEDLYFKGLYNNSSYSKQSDIAKVRIDKTAPTASMNFDFTGKDNAKIIISDIVEKGSGIKGYYISTEETEPTDGSTWVEAQGETINIENLSINTNYYVWLIDKAGNISEKYSTQIESPNYLVDNKIYTKTLEQAISSAQDNSEIKLLNDYTDDSTATINKNITFDVQDYTLTRTKVITVNSGKTANIVGNGTITSSTNNYTFSNNGTLNVNMQGKITSTVANSSYGAISNSGTLTIENGTVSGYARGIYSSSSSSVININQGRIETTYQNNSAYAIYSSGTINVNGGDINGWYGIRGSSSNNKINIYGGTITGTGAYGIYGYGTVTINGGIIKGKTYGIYQYSGTLNVNDGNIEGDYGIYQYSSAIVNILGGRVYGDTYGVYGYTTAKITIGDINLDVNTQNPVVSGGLYGIYMKDTTYTYNFNNGIIMGTNTIPYTEKVVPREGYMVQTYYDFNGFRKYCSVLTRTVDNITIEHTPTDWTNQDVELQVRYPVIEGATMQFSEDGENWKEVNNGYITNITENKKVYARMLDQSGIILETAEHEITNIDKTAPTVSISPETTKYIIYDKDTTSVDISITVTLKDEGGSGISTSKYGWSNSREEQPTQWTDFSSGDTITKSKCDVGTYYLWFDVSDVAGNTSDIDVIRYIVELEEAVAKIGDNYYYTIQDAIDAAGTTSATVEIIKDTDEVVVVKEGQNIILDLQGHTVGSSSSEQAVITNNGTLNIIDSSTEKTGTIENLVGTAIINNGTLTIGDNADSIDDSTPTISGKKTGISNNATLNYYDGTIKGKIAIEGEVQGTPESYGPVGVYEDGITTVSLKVISDYAARIEWFYYTTLQSAFDACEAKENNANQTTVVMLKDIVLNEGSNVYYGQNVRLNLNGHTLTSTNGSVITNYGKLDITDLSEEQTGTISSSVGGQYNNYYKLINNQKELIISGGNISTDKSYNYPIYNENGTVDINGGTVSGSLYGIYNNGTGTINVSGGTVSSSNSFGIYNSSTGTINVSGGNINCGDGSDGSGYGIYNAGTGIVNINAGTVSSNKRASYSGWTSSCGVYNASIGTINVSGGTVESYGGGQTRSGIYNAGLGIINVSGGIVTSKDSSGIYNAGLGMINISGGTVTSSANAERGNSSGILNVRAGIVNVRGGSVSSKVEGIKNNGTGTINVSGGTVSSSGSSNSYGIYNYSTGTINVSGGTVSSSGSSNSYGIYNCSTGTIVLGTKGNATVSNTTPNIISEYTGTYRLYSGYGIYNPKGTFKFYDGIIQASNYIVSGGITEIEDNYEVKEDEADEYKRLYLVPVNKENYVIENTNTGKQYINIKDAISEVTADAYELKMLQDIDLLTDINILENTKVKLDLNGKTINNNYFLISNYGNLDITDSGLEGKIINNETKLVNLGQGNLEITGGTVSSSGSRSYTYGISNSSTGTINVNGGIVNSSGYYGIYNSSTGIINVNEGTVRVVGEKNNGGWYYGIYNESTGIINVNGGTVSVDDINSYGIYNAINGIININGGVVKTERFGISNTGAGTINVNDGTVSGNPYGIYNYSTGTINVTGGSVRGSGSSGNPYGIYNYSTGTIVLGTKGDGIVSDTTPNIIGEYTGTSTSYSGYGIYNPKGTFKFYDGRIEGSTRAIPEDHFISEIEDDTTIVYEDENKVLTLSTGATDVAKIGDVTYTSLQEAIDAAGTNQTTIELLRGIQYTNQDVTLTVAQDQDITLDLKGFPIVSAIEDAVITNNGKLKITDTTEGVKGKISGTYERTIYNKPGATLDLNKGTITRNTAKDNVIYNEGTANVTGGIISQPGSSGYSIYNAENSTLNISDGQITGGTKGIYNIGNTNITNGTIEKGITNTNTGILKIVNGTITGEITNSENANIEMTGGNIQVTASYGIRNTSIGTVTISGGTITSNQYGIYSTAGTINIGTKEGTISETPVITGNTSGIYVTSTLNIYDGIIKGKTSAISGDITEIEEMSEIVVGEEDEYETVSLVKIDTPLAQVGENKYYSLKEAIDSISDVGTVSILREGTVAETINILEGKDITLDLNGNNLKMYTRIQNAGTLKITDTSTQKTGKLTGYKDSPIYNSGNLELLNGSILGNSYGIYNQTNGTTNIEGGTLTQNTYGIYVVGGVVNIKDGIISDNTYGTFTYNSNGTINISGGNINNNQYGVYNSAGTTNISGGTINGNTNEIYNGGTGTINIISGSIVTSNETAIENASSGTIIIGAEDGNVIVESPLIQAEEYGIKNTGNGTIKFYDGTIKGKKGGLLGLYLYTESSYSVKTDYTDEYYSDSLTPSGTISTVAKIGSIEYTNLQSAINACTSETATTITLVNSINTNTAFNIEEGQNVIIDLNGKSIISTTAENTIENAGNLTIIDSSSNQTGNVTNSYAVAITNSGTLTLGQDDLQVSTSCPEISGNTYGIKNTGTFNFYDGIIKASIAIDGNVSSRPNNYVINKTTVDGIEQLVLGR